MAVWADLNKVNCQKCTETVKKFRGCKDDILPFDVCGFEITRCPRSFFDYDVGFLITVYGEYVKGNYPNDGGWLDQPMKCSDAMNLIEKVVAEQEEQDGKHRH